MGELRALSGTICAIVVSNVISALIDFSLGAAEVAIGAQYSGIAGTTNATNVTGTTDVPKTFMWCQIQPIIPTYLIVNGAICHIFVGVLLIGVTIGLLCGSGCLTKCCLVFSGIVGLFSLAWIIAGSVWIYSIKNTFSSNPSNPANYCQPTLYWFAFWVTTVSWILAAVQFVAQCCTKRSSDDYENLEK